MPKDYLRKMELHVDKCNKSRSKPDEVGCKSMFANFHPYKGCYKNINGSTIKRHINGKWYLRDEHQRTVDFDKDLNELLKRNGLNLS